VVFPGEVEGGGEGFGDVAGGAEDGADDGAVWAAFPSGRFSGGEPVSGGGHEGFAEGGATGDEVEEAGEAVGGAEDVRVAVGEGDVFFDGDFYFINGEVGESGDEGGDLGEATDVLVLNPAFLRRFSGGVALEEAAVVFFEIGIAVPAGGEHGVEVEVDPGGGVVVSGLADLVVECSGELEVDGGLSGLELLVVVDAFDAPEGGLVVEDVVFWAGDLVL